ncbi:MAG: hypothetical protein HOD63_15000 [Bacteroidetes bacterium]|jgi:hypothetical protein|nr:hypothetical protein [Bacteroidota bacterium]MBT6837243.1 hypothetical protein [Bacteroidota bacterium]MBT7994928.1 hypothetical protein [Bacteroidota bacterium]
MNIDPLTKQEFVPRHLNQRFESRKNQIKYNNLKARRKRAAKKKYDQPLDRNRNILIKILNGSNEAIKSKDWLLALGYNFNIYTHSSIHDGKIITCIYEFGLLKLDLDKYKIIRNGNY